MASSGIEIVGANRLRRILRDQQKAYQKEMQESLAMFIDATRLTAADKFIIDSQFPSILNPRILSRRQKSQAGKLTSRTGKLRWMLKENANPLNPSAKWSPFGNRLTRNKTAMLANLIRYKKEGTSSRASGTQSEDEYEGTTRFKFHYMHQRMRNTGTPFGVNPFRWMPRETVKTLRFRFVHEFRGREFIHPAARLMLRKLENKINRDIGRIWSRGV